MINGGGFMAEIPLNDASHRHIAPILANLINSQGVFKKSYLAFKNENFISTTDLNDKNILTIKQIAECIRDEINETHLLPTQKILLDELRWIIKNYNPKPIAVFLQMFKPELVDVKDTEIQKDREEAMRIYKEVEETLKNKPKKTVQFTDIAPIPDEQELKTTGHYEGFMLAKDSLDSALALLDQINPKPSKRLKPLLDSLDLVKIAIDDFKEGLFDNEDIDQINNKLNLLGHYFKIFYKELHIQLKENSAFLDLAKQAKNQIKDAVENVDDFYNSFEKKIKDLD